MSQSVSYLTYPISQLSSILDSKQNEMTQSQKSTKGSNLSFEPISLIFDLSLKSTKLNTSKQKEITQS